MNTTQKLERSINELRRITGLPIELPLDDDANLEMIQQQLSTLCNAYKAVTNKESILKSWLLSSISEDEFLSYASRMHLPLEERRALFLIQFSKEPDYESITMLKNMISDPKTMVFSVRPNQVVVIHQLTEKQKYSLKDTAYEYLNIITSELMVHTLIAYGEITSHACKLPEAFQEAQFALEVGTLFYPDRTIFGYNEMGVGSLLYGLPEEVCKKYIRNNLGDYFLTNKSSVFSSDVMETADCFLRCNLNIAETARQLHIHRNTLLYRLEEIEKETGLDIRKFNAAMTYKLCSMVLHYLNTNM